MNENKSIDPKLADALKGIYDSLTDEQKEKAKACKDMNELTALLGQMGVELPDELLDAVAGGYIHYSWWGGWEIIEDSTGAVLARVSDNASNHWDAKGHVKYAALNMGHSPTQRSATKNVPD